MIRIATRFAPVVVGAALVAALGSSSVRAQDKPADKKNIGSKADQAAEEEARKAREAREARVPELKQEDREAFEKREKTTAGSAPIDAYTTFRRQIEFQTQEKRKQLIAQLDKILMQNPPEDEKPELLFQKAELFLEEGTYHFFRGNEADDAIAAALSNGDDAKLLSLQEGKDKELEISKKWGSDAIKIYETIEKKYPKFERMPDVLYSLGQAYWDRTEYKEALKVYRRLIKEFPKAQYIPDAWLAFGEFYFQVAPDEERDVKKALDAYEKAAAIQDSPVFGYATYKQGWCHYNLNRYDKATDKFKEVILYSQINEKMLGQKKIGLAKEARKDYVLAYAQYGGAQQAPAEFKTVADNPADQRNMLERLADIYYGDGKDRDAIITYQTLMKMQPDNTKNPLYQAKIVKLASRIGEKRQVVAQARKLSDEYKRVRAVFANIKDGDPKKEDVGNDLKAADDVSDNTLRFLATTWHNEAKKTLDNSTFEYAYELYGDYLDLFPERKEAYEMRFFYAELLYRLEKFEQAGEQYVKVFLQDKKGKWAEASAEESVRAYDEVVKDFDRANKGKSAPAVGTKEQPIPEVKKKLMAACKNYIEAYPKGKIAIEAEYKIARIFYEYNYFNESTPRFAAFVDAHPDHPRAEQAANLVLDTYGLLEDYENLNQTARKFIANDVLMKNPEFKDLVAKIVEESSFKLIAKYEKEKAWEKAGKRYLAFADEFPKSALADKALANAAATFTRAGQLDRAIKVRIRLVNTYKDSPLVADQMYAIAAAYEQIVAYKDSASWLEKFFEKYSKDPGQKDRAKDALFNASIYRHGTGDTKQAVADRELYLKTFPDAADAEDVTFSIATAWEESGNLKKAIEAYNDFADKFRRKNAARALNAQYKAYRLLEKSRGSKNELEKALKNLEIQGNVYKKSGKPLDDVGDPLALVAFRNADEVLEKYKDIKIAKPDKPAEFKRTLEQKRKAKEAVDAAYLEVVKLKSAEWAVASLFRNGEATADLVKSILAVPPPKGLTDEQSQLFKSKLEEQTLPLEEAAANYMTLCLDKSAEFAVFNEWTKKCLGYLEENRPQTYPKDSLEKRDSVVVNTRAPEHGTGVVLEIPKVGEKPKVEPGTDPPPPPAGVKVTVQGVAPSEAPKGTMDFSEGDGGGQ
jgi:tetratricopeptide (TPR) repeat protein